MQLAWFPQCKMVIETRNGYVSLLPLMGIYIPENCCTYMYIIYTTGGGVTLIKSSLVRTWTICGLSISYDCTPTHIVESIIV